MILPPAFIFALVSIIPRNAAGPSTAREYGLLIPVQRAPGISGGTVISEFSAGPIITVAVRNGGIAPKIAGPSINDPPLI